MRAPTCEIQTGLKKGSWSHEEDKKLVSYINKYGIWNWPHMPKFAGLSRSGKSCRLRWMNYLKPNLKRGNFLKDEEEIILHSHSVLGNKWSAIASRLPGRTDNEIKNHWHTHLKKHVPETTKQNEMTTSLRFEDYHVQKIQRPPDHVNDMFNSCSATECDRSSSSRTTSSKGHHVDFNAYYGDIGSPGTADDLPNFWEQLCPFENLEL